MFLHEDRTVENTDDWEERGTESLGRRHVDKPVRLAVRFETRIPISVASDETSSNERQTREEKKIAH